MKLILKALPATVLGIYGPNKDTLPARMRLLAPEAHAAFMAAHEAGLVLRLSDCFRSPEASLQARKEKRGVQPPGFSAHGFGLAVDVAIEAELARLKISKAKYDERMAEYGWYCHRRDHVVGFEAWHFNYGIRNELRAKETTTAPAVERLMQRLHGAEWALTPEATQEHLSRLGFYGGEVDGKIGPLSKAALGAFQRAWGLNPNGEADARTRRVLALVGCEKEIVG